MSVRQIPRNVINELPRPVVSEINVPRPVVRGVKPPVVRGISPPVVNVPDTSIEYPTLDAPTEEQFQGDLSPQQPSRNPTNTPDTRDLPITPIPPVETQPTFDVGGMEIPIPDLAPLVAAGSLAVVTTVVTLGATIVVGQVKTALEPSLKRVLKKKKIKIKKVKPVIHFIPNEDGSMDVLEYNAKGVRLVDSSVTNIEQYLRDQVEIDALWEYDNKVIIDEALSKGLTKEGKRRFKSYFAKPSVIAKKLGSKFSF